MPIPSCGFIELVPKYLHIFSFTFVAFNFATSIAAVPILIINAPNYENGHLYIYCLLCLIMGFIHFIYRSYNDYQEDSEDRVFQEFLWKPHHGGEIFNLNLLVFLLGLAPFIWSCYLLANVVSVHDNIYVTKYVSLWTLSMVYICFYLIVYIYKVVWICCCGVLDMTGCL